MINWKNYVTFKHYDSNRLFGIAHLCFTEIEDIVNGEVTLDDLDVDDDDDDDDDDTDDDDDGDIIVGIKNDNLPATSNNSDNILPSTPPLTCPSCGCKCSPSSSLPSTSRRTSSNINNNSMLVETTSIPPASSPQKAPSTPSSSTAGGTPSRSRTSRLYKARSIRNSVRNSIRMSSLLLSGITTDSSSDLAGSPLLDQLQLLAGDEKSVLASGPFRHELSKIDEDPLDSKQLLPSSSMTMATTLFEEPTTTTSSQSKVDETNNNPDSGRNSPNRGTQGDRSFSFTAGDDNHETSTPPPPLLLLLGSQEAKDSDSSGPPLLFSARSSSLMANFISNQPDLATNNSPQINRKTAPQTWNIEDDDILADLESDVDYIGSGIVSYTNTAPTNPVNPTPTNHAVLKANETPPPQRPATADSITSKETTISPRSEYLPRIPTSPLIHTQATIQQELMAASLELQSLQSSNQSGGSRSQAVMTLQKLRKAMEDTAILRSKLSQASARIISASSRRLPNDLSPLEIAAGITFVDWNIFAGYISLADLATFSELCHNNPNPHETLRRRPKVPISSIPSSIRSLLDFSVYLFRLILSSILAPSLTPEGRAQLISFWIQVADILGGNGAPFRNFQSQNTITCALTHALLVRLGTSVWALVPKKHFTKLEELTKWTSPAHGYAAHRDTLRSNAVSSMAALAPLGQERLIPILAMVLEDLSKCSDPGANSLAAINTQWSQWVGAVGVAGGAGGGGVGGGAAGGAATAAKSNNDAVPSMLAVLVHSCKSRAKLEESAHWVVSQSWVSESDLIDNFVDVTTQTTSAASTSMIPQEILQGPKRGRGKRLLEAIKNKGQFLMRRTATGAWVSAKSQTDNLEQDQWDPFWFLTTSFPLGYCGSPLVGFSEMESNTSNTTTTTTALKPSAATTPPASTMTETANPQLSLLDRLQKLGPMSSGSTSSGNSSSQSTSTPNRPPSPTPSVLSTIVGHTRSTNQLILEALPVPPKESHLIDYGDFGMDESTNPRIQGEFEELVRRLDVLKRQ